MSTPPRLVLCELEDTGIPGLETYSPFCLKIHRALRAAGLPYERRLSPNPRSFRAYNRTGQVPVLLVDDVPVADSTSILERINQLTHDVLLPEDPRARAEAWLWEELADTSLNGFLLASRWADERNWPTVRARYFAGMPGVVRAIVPGMIRKRLVAMLVARDVWRRSPEACWERFTALLASLEARAPREGFWVGPTISVADVAIFGQLHGMRFDVSPWQRDQIAAHLALTAWLDRVQQATAAER